MGRRGEDEFSPIIKSCLQYKIYTNVRYWYKSLWIIFSDKRIFCNFITIFNSWSILIVLSHSLDFFPLCRFYSAAGLQLNRIYWNSFFVLVCPKASYKCQFIVQKERLKDWLWHDASTQLIIISRHCTFRWDERDSCSLMLEWRRRRSQFPLLFRMDDVDSALTREINDHVSSYPPEHLRDVPVRSFVATHVQIYRR